MTTWPKRFLCTGLILASNKDELALQAILDGWQEIDAYTADRIRFLFFVEGEQTIGGYRGRPSFTEVGFERHNEHLYASARNRGFRISPRPGFQSDYGKSHWNPQEQVLKLARSLGISREMPCLVWIRDDSPSNLYYRSIRGLSPTEIVSMIRSFAEEFYDNNVTALTRIRETEYGAERLCGALDATAGEIEALFRAAQSLKQVRNFLKGFQDIPYSQRDRSALTSHLDRLMKTLPDLPIVSTVAHETELLRRSKNLVRTSRAIEDFLAGKRVIPVREVVSMFVKCHAVVHNLPATTARLMPLKLTVTELDVGEFHEVATAFLKQATADPGTSETKEGVRRLVEFLEAERMPDQYEAHITTLATMYMCLKSVVAANDPRAVSLFNRVQAQLSNGFSDVLYAFVISVHLWLYSEYYFASLRLESRLSRISMFVEYSAEELNKIRSVVIESLRGVDRIAKSVDWNALSKYDHRSIFGFCPSELLHDVPRDVSRMTYASDPERLVYDLEERLASRLDPIHRAMNEVSQRDLRTVEEQIRAASGGQSINVLVSPGAEIGIAGTIIHKEDRQMTNIQVEVGDGNIFHGPFVVAQRVKDSFAKAGEAGVGDELKTLLKQLVTDTSRLAQGLPEETASDVTQALQTFVTEATKANPRRKWYEVSSDGLIEAAKAIGEAGEPIIRTVGSILKLLGIWNYRGVIATPARRSEHSSL